MDGYEVVSAYKDGNNTGRFEDIDTRLLGETDLIVTLGTSSDVQARDVEPREAHFKHFPRTYVLGKQ